MNLEYHEPIIILIAGKARSGKNTTANILKKIYEKNKKKVIISPYTKYLKKYIEEITGNIVDENHKPRELLQQLGVEIIKQKLGKKDMLINRQIDDIDIYSYFFDVIIIPDVRFPIEIDAIRDKYSKVTVIKVVGEQENSMTEKEKKHITETALDDYSDSNFDYVIYNSNMTNLEKEIEEIYLKIK